MQNLVYTHQTLIGPFLTNFQPAVSK